MMYKAKLAVCSDIRTKHSTQSERHVEFLNVKTWWYGKEPLGSNRLRQGRCTKNYIDMPQSRSNNDNINYTLLPARIPNVTVRNL